VERLGSGLLDLAKYPFLAEAGDYVRAHGLSVEALADPEYAPIVDRARQRILAAARGRELSGSPDERDILSFPLAMLLVKATKLEHLAAKFSLAEATRAERLLAQERDPQVLHEVLQKVANLTVEPVELEVAGKRYDFRMPMVEFLRRAPKLHADKWRLINQVVVEGHVLLMRADLARLFREEIAHQVQQKLRSVSAPRLPAVLDAVVREIVAATPPPPPSALTWHRTPDQYPPCIVHILEKMKRSENVAHFGRFLHATYLLTVGLTVDEVLDQYRASPDFNERIARYQIEHLAGLRGGRRKYRVPNCRTVLSHNMCFRHPTYCYNIVTPLQYPSKYAKRRKLPAREAEGR
jgi:DNA primase large subunit